MLYLSSIYFTDINTEKLETAIFFDQHFVSLTDKLFYKSVPSDLSQSSWRRFPHQTKTNIIGFPMGISLLCPIPWGVTVRRFLETSLSRSRPSYPKLPNPALYGYVECSVYSVLQTWGGGTRRTHVLAPVSWGGRHKRKQGSLNCIGDEHCIG